MIENMKSEFMDYILKTQNHDKYSAMTTYPLAMIKISTHTFHLSKARIGQQK